MLFGFVFSVQQFPIRLFPRCVKFLVYFLTFPFCPPGHTEQLGSGKGVLLLPAGSRESLHFCAPSIPVARDALQTH